MAETRNLPPDDLDVETLRPGASRSGPRALVVPCLTLLAHPDPARVGERAAILDLLGGGSVSVSRLVPVFTRPGEPDGAPLADLYLSRRPLVITARVGAVVRLDATQAPGAVRLDGVPLESTHDLPAGELAAGRVITLADRVVLLLHLVQSGAGAVRPRHGLVGASDALETVRTEIDCVARADAPVLLRGESGTGKELVARAIHAASPRAAGPFVAINMAALPPATAAAELFGHRRGAFTGAVGERLGCFRQASGGTLFLDEIGDTPLDVQPMLLRALEAGVVRPLGSDTEVSVDVRVLAATDADLEGAVGAERFRAPLLHRLGGYVLELPPLRARRADLGLLLVNFLRRELSALGAGRRLDPSPGGREPWLPAALVERLAAYPWPGNVRELANVARQMALLGAEGDTAPVELILARLGVGEARRSASSPGPAASEPLALDDDALIAALRAHDWRPRPTARALGISRTTLYARMERCPRIRAAKDLSEAEIQGALGDHGDVGAAAAALEVSERGLRLRLNELARGRDGR